MKITDHLPQAVGPAGSRPEVKPPSTSPPTPPRTTNTKETPPEPNRPAVQAAVAVLNTQLALEHRSIRFSIEEHTDEIIVTIHDDETGEIVRRIPPDTTVALAANLDNLNGALFSSYG